MPCPEPRVGNETARVHNTLRRCSGRVAAGGACQQSIPVIGYLSARSPDNSADIVAAFRQGLNEAGFTDGQNVRIESRFADGNFDRLPGLAADLVARKVSILVAAGGTSP